MLSSLRGLGDDPTCVTGSIDASSGDTLVCPETVGSSGILQFYQAPGGQATSNPLVPASISAPQVTNISWITMALVTLGIIAISSTGGGSRRR